MPTFRQMCSRVLSRAKKNFPYLKGTKVAQCPYADNEHAASERQFCHVGHRKGFICYAKAADDLKPAFQVGLAVHEIGHLVGFVIDPRHSENDANHYGEMVTGIPVEWWGSMRLERAKKMPKWLTAKKR